MKTIAVIGGGASGLIAAISAARELKLKRNTYRIVILERCERVGRKLLATGNGRCNITNKSISINRYHGDVSFAEKVMSRFDYDKTKEFFESIGIMFYEEESGKIYPLSLQAGSVLDALRLECAKLNIEEKCSFDVCKVQKANGKYLVLSAKGEKIIADYVIFSCGGMASPNLGSNGSGYKLLDNLGHKKTPKLYPSLVQVKTLTDYVKQVKGIKFTGEVTLFKGTEKLKSEFGEVLFTEYGISGPPVLQISRKAAVNINQGTEVYVLLDFLTQYSFDELLKLLLERQKILYDRKLDAFFIGMINKQISQMIIKKSLLQVNSNVKDITKDDIRKLTENIKFFKLECTGTMSFKNAQVTAGGILTKDFNAATLESKVAPGLYACGEVLNVDGDCGGFNLQWAWSSGYIAGKSCAEQFNKANN